MCKHASSNLNITAYTIVVCVAGEKINYASMNITEDEVRAATDRELLLRMTELYYDTMKEGESDEVTGSIEVQRWYRFDCRSC